mgnify:CR=1 FL=1
MEPLGKEQECGEVGLLRLSRSEMEPVVICMGQSCIPSWDRMSGEGREGLAGQMSGGTDSNRLLRQFGDIIPLGKTSQSHTQSDFANRDDPPRIPSVLLDQLDQFSNISFLTTLMPRNLPRRGGMASRRTMQLCL